MEEISFGEWLSRQRKSLGLTQKQLAEQIGCAVITLRKIEAEERRPSPQMTDRLAQIFQISSDDREAFQQFVRGDWQQTPRLPGKQPAWRPSQQSFRSNLPVPLTSLIGREQDIPVLLNYLTEGAIRLVSLLGPPGIGKTRLSLEVAAQAQSFFPDGVFFVPLAPLEDPHLLAATILQALGFREVKGQAQVERLIDNLKDKQLLLVLDNTEHLTDGVVPLLTELLTNCPYIKILVTSREALRVTGEWQYHLQVIALPTESDLHSLDVGQISRYAGVRLFLERARSVRVHFSLNQENILAVVAICKQLDGLPLAIELFAAQMRLMTPQELLKRLDHPSMLQTAANRSEPERQRTMDNAIRWSYNLLSSAEKDFFNFMSIFSGGITLKMAESTFSAELHPEPVSQLITALLDKSLLQTAGDVLGETRFTMLVPLQQFALERLRESHQETGARQKHLAYFSDLANRADHEIHGPDQVNWIDQIEVNQDNLRAALNWCLVEQKTEQALHLLNMLAWLWLLRGNYTETFYWFERVRSLPEPRTYPLLYASLLTRVARTHWLVGAFDQAKALLEECRAIGRTAGSQGDYIEAEALNYLGRIAINLPNGFDQARLLFEQAIPLHQKCGYLTGEAFARLHLGIVASLQGQEDEAMRLSQQSLNLYQQTQDLWGLARACQVMGELHLKRGETEKALSFFQQHLRMDEQLQFQEGTTVALENLGLLYRLQGNYDQAEAYYQQCLDHARSFGLNVEKGQVLFEVGLVALNKQKVQLAKDLFIRSFHQVLPADQTEAACRLFLGLAGVAIHTDQPERAARLSGAAQAALESMIRPLPAWDTQELEHYLHLARQQLGKTRCADCLADGRSLNFDQAIRYALEQDTAQSHSR